MFDDEPITQPIPPAHSEKKPDLEALNFLLEVRVLLLTKRLQWAESVIAMLLDERDDTAA